MPRGRILVRLGDWLRPPRHLLSLFLLITFVIAILLGWLTWRLIEQDRALEGQRTQEGLDHAADLINASILRSLSQIDQQLSHLAALQESQLAAEAQLYGDELSDQNAAILVLNAAGFETYPGNRLYYVPSLPASNEAPASLFAAGEASEFQQKDFGKAITLFRELARSPEPDVQAGALLRMARNFRKAGRIEAAMATYQELTPLSSVTIEGLPAESLGRHARCLLLEELGNRPQLQQEAGSFNADLHKPKWRLDRAAYRFYAEEARRWLGPNAGALADEKRLGLAESAEALWQEWQRIRRGEGTPSGRANLVSNSHSLIQIWRGTPDRLIGLIADPRYFEQRWLTALSSWVESRDERVVLTDVEGRQVLGQITGPAIPQSVRTVADTGLPWTLHVVSAQANSPLVAGRWALLFGGLVMMVMLGEFSSRANPASEALLRFYCRKQGDEYVQHPCGRGRADSCTCA